MPTAFSAVIHTAAHLCRRARRGFPARRPHPLPPPSPRSGYPGSGTPCPRSGGCQELFLVCGIHAVHVHRAAVRQQHGVEVLGQVDLPQPLCTQHRHKLPALYLHGYTVQHIGTGCSSHRSGTSNFQQLKSFTHLALFLFSVVVRPPLKGAGTRDAEPCRQSLLGGYLLWSRLSPPLTDGLALFHCGPPCPFFTPCCSHIAVAPQGTTPPVADTGRPISSQLVLPPRIAGY